MRQHPFSFGWEAISAARMPRFLHNKRVKQMWFSTRATKRKKSCCQMLYILSFMVHQRKNYWRFAAIVILKPLSMVESAALLKCNKFESQGTCQEQNPHSRMVKNSSWQNKAGSKAKCSHSFSKHHLPARSGAINACDNAIMLMSPPRLF